MFVRFTITTAVLGRDLDADRGLGIRGEQVLGRRDNRGPVATDAVRLERAAGDKRDALRINVGGDRAADVPSKADRPETFPEGIQEHIAPRRRIAHDIETRLKPLAAFVRFDLSVLDPRGSEFGPRCVVSQ